MTVEREQVERGIWRRRTVGGQWVHEISYRDSNGVQRRQTVHGGLKAARVALADVQARRGKGERVARSPRLTFAEAADRWLDSKRARKAPATIAAYESHLRTHLRPRWGKRQLDRFTVDDVASLIEDLTLQGKKAWTIRGALVVTGGVFDFARRRLRWAGENPVRSLLQDERPENDERPRRILTSDELAAVVEASKGPHRLAVVIAAMTGARLGEVLGLRWRNFDLEAATLSIEAQLDRTGSLAKCKTERSRRTLDLPSPLVAELRQQYRARASLVDDFILKSSTGRPLDHRTVTRSFAAALKRAGVVDPRPTFHDLRHSFASRFIAAGGDMVTLSTHLGHANPAITARVYAHEFERSSRGDERRARLDAMFGSNVAARERDTSATDGPVVAGEVLEIQPVRESA